MINDKLLYDLNNIFINYKEVEKVLLFGSRARNDNKNYSDVDWCLFGKDITHLIYAKIVMDIEEINTPLSFDIVNFNELSKKEFINNILTEGIEIYNGKEIRWEKK